MGARFNEPQFNEAVFGGGVAAAPDYSPDYSPEIGSFVAPAVFGDRYTLEVQTPARVLVAFLPDAVNPVWTQTINEASMLTFDYPLDSDQAAAITFPNVIVLRDKDAHYLDAFIIAQTSSKRTDDGRLTLSVHAEGYLSQLSRVTVENYEVINTSVNAIIKALLAMQPADNPWQRVQLGSVNTGMGATKIDLSVNNKTILQVLNDVRDIVGGYFKVEMEEIGEPVTEWNTRPLFHWGILKGLTYTPRLISCDRNSPWMTMTRDYRTIRTRVVAYGAGASPDTRIKSTATSSAEKIALYGTQTAVYTDSSITTQAALDKYAAARLAEREVPRTEYYIGAIELNEIDTGAEWFDEPLSLGDAVNVYDYEIGVTLSTCITRISRPLGRSGSIEHGGGMDGTGTRGAAGGIDGSGSAIKGTTIELSDPNASISSSGYSGKRNKPPDLIDELIALRERLDDLTIGDPGYVESIVDAVLEEIDLDDINWEENGVATQEWVQQQINTAVGNIDIPEPGTNIQSVGSANSAGTGTAYARENHVHAGSIPAVWQPWLGS